MSEVWRRHRQNPVLSLRPGHFDSNHIHAPIVVHERGRYRMWYSGSDCEENIYHRIGYAESPDGVSWSRLDDPIIVPCSNRGYYTTPTVLRISNGATEMRYMMWFTGKPDTSDLHLALSRDGTSWKIQRPDPLEMKAYSPTVLFEDDAYRMWYTRLEGDGSMAIGHATSHDGINWEPRQSPVLVSTEPWEKRHLLYPYVLSRPGAYEMYYTSYGPGCELGVATSTDGIKWEKGRGPILSPDPTSKWDSLYCACACVVPDPGGKDKLYYASRVDMLHKYYAIGLAERTEAGRDGYLR